jgi:hypothetical protein
VRDILGTDEPKRGGDAALRPSVSHGVHAWDVVAWGEAALSHVPHRPASWALAVV